MEVQIQFADRVTQTLRYLSERDVKAVESALDRIRANPFSPALETVQMTGDRYGFAARVSPALRLLYGVTPLDIAASSEMVGGPHCSVEVVIDDIVSDEMLRHFSRRAHEAA